MPKKTTTTKLPTMDYAAFGRAVATIIANTRRRRAANSDDATRLDLEAFDAILAEAYDHVRSWKAAEKEAAMVRHACCRHCGQDIEGIAPFKRGEWRDRGNNRTCPTQAGDKGQKHVPLL